MVVREKQKGFIMLELLLFLALILLFSAQALPAMFKFYRQVAVEFEAEYLLTDIRRCQSLSRTIAEPAWGYGAKDLRRRYARLDLFPGGNRITAGGAYIIERHLYLPGIQVAKLDEQQDYIAGDDKIQVGFRADGSPQLTEGMITLLIFFGGYEQEGCRIMVSKGGRIRMERDNHEKK
ncbi:Tfp pilus assembly protein FimT [Selenomonas ruminantium]|uniref:Tfp pilus assembly protein FimT n=1 Tax=Selenomonas ruminantium TaxID=971 RepID=A0A1M6WHU1_SELRU|nr:hypothetical protein [Selenomonas ruminantium]SHK93320.1 Tfp pilus assembly protein FimT [Selenomonas ruminantium]